MSTREDKAARKLWTLLDDIDTADDMAKGNHDLYRNLVREAVRKRHEMMVSDGYVLTYTDDPDEVDAPDDLGPSPS